MRCVGHPAAMFPQEVHMDRLAEKLGMDPLSFRLKNHARKEDGDQDRKFPFSSIGWKSAQGWVRRRSDGRATGKNPGEPRYH